MKHRLRKTLFAVVAAAATAASVLAVAPTATATARTTDDPNPIIAPVEGGLGPAIFLTPHQDDETLTMGAAIREHVLAGRDTWVLLLTDGASSGVCQKAPYNGDLAACTAERDREYRNAVHKMGAHAVVLADRKRDGANLASNTNPLTRSYVEAVIQRWAATYPNASFKTMSEFDTIHIDHRILGQGLWDAYNDGITSDARWYIRQEDENTFKGSCTSRHNLNTALELYEPIGWDSVPRAFAYAWDSKNQSRDYAAYSKVYTPAQRNVRASGGICYTGTYKNTSADDKAQRAETP